MLAEMSLRTWHEWVAYFQIEPFGEERADVRSATIASTVANASRTKRGQRAFKIGDFMPDYGRQTKKQSAAEQEAIFSAFADAHNRARKKRGAS